LINIDKTINELSELIQIQLIKIVFADHAILKDIIVQDLVQRGLERPIFS